EMLADLAWQLGGEVVGQPLRQPFPERLERRAAGGLGLAAAAQVGAGLHLSDQLVVLHVVPPHDGSRLPPPFPASTGETSHTRTRGLKSPRTARCGADRRTSRRKAAGVSV